MHISAASRQDEDMTMTTPSADTPFRIGTRGSPLALAQAHETRARLMQAHDLPEEAFEIIVIKTTGDKVLDRPLGEIGGKGLFTKEIEDAMLEGSIDIAVHSMKDMPVEQPDGLALTCYLPREDVRDAFVSLTHGSLAEMPAGTAVGSSSLRRRAQIKFVRPDLEVVEFRGNVQTRMKKLNEGVADATFLAMAGLRRLGMEEVIRDAMDVGDMLPAVAQGAIGIEQHRDNAQAAAMLAPINDRDTTTRLAAERSFLAGLDGSCQTPIGGLAVLDKGQLTLSGEIIRPDGSEKHADVISGPASDAARMGAELAAKLKALGGDDFFVT